MTGPLTAYGDARLPGKLWSLLMITEGGCWTWKGSKDKWGYGKVTWRRRRCLTHRVVYEVLVGVIAEGLHLDHLCKNRACANPHHLDPVTPRVNALRSEGVSTRNARKTRCEQGHPFTPENTYLEPKRSVRACRTCRNAASARYRSRKREGAA